LNSSISGSESSRITNDNDSVYTKYSFNYADSTMTVNNLVIPADDTNYGSDKKQGAHFSDAEQATSWTHTTNGPGWVLDSITEDTPWVWSTNRPVLWFELP